MSDNGCFSNDGEGHSATHCKSYPVTDTEYVQDLKVSRFSLTTDVPYSQATSHSEAQLTNRRNTIYRNCLEEGRPNVKNRRVCMSHQSMTDTRVISRDEVQSKES